MRKKKGLTNGDIVRLIITLIILIVSVGIIGDEAGERYIQQKKFDELRGKDILKLYEKNHDLVGWIKVPDTKINYPVMLGEKYLHQNFDGEYSLAGTPFVYDDWTPSDTNSLIFGHNMIDGSMFANIHKFEDRDFWESHKKAKFWVICEDVHGEKYVEERIFKIRNILMTSVDDSWLDYAGIKSPALAYEYQEDCDNKDLYDTGVEKSDSVITLCTCSYHIRGDRNAGRIIAVGALQNIKYNTKVK